MKRYPLASKIFTLLVFVFILLLPVSAIMGLIDERASYREEVVRQISSSTSGKQILVGPILVIPYKYKYWELEPQTDDTRTEKVYVEKTRRANYYVLPEALDANTQLRVESRHLGIYQAQVYESETTFFGQFSLPIIAEMEAANIEVGQPYLSVGIADVRGIRDIPKLVIEHADDVTVTGNKANTVSFQAGTSIPSMSSGLHAPVSLASFQQPQKFTYNFKLSLQGTGSLAFVPIGETSSYSLKGDWPHPNFLGNFLPTHRDITDTGFSARWNSTWLANEMNNHLRLGTNDCGFNSTRECKSVSGIDIQRLPAFYTSLVETVDQYQLNQRSVKYAFLFIGLTFIAFFLMEVLKTLRVHPVQYILVGAALILFYLLLLALSEHVGFNLAYLTASAACVGLITYYVSHVLGGFQRGLGFGALLGILYGSLWGLLQSVDNSLLLGSLLLFVVLALVMIITRKLDWYGLSENALRKDGEDLFDEILLDKALYDDEK